MNLLNPMTMADDEAFLTVTSTGFLSMPRPSEAWAFAAPARRIQARAALPRIRFGRRADKIVLAIFAPGVRSPDPPRRRFPPQG